MPEFNIGSVTRANGMYEGGFRINEDGALVTDDGHSRFYEAACRGNAYTVTTALTGTAIAAANVAPPAAAAATVLSMLNPVGSGVNLEILQGWIAHISTATTTNAGMWCWCASGSGVSITANESAAVIKRPLRVGQRVSGIKAWTQAALTGGRVHFNVRPFPMGRLASALSAQMDQKIMVDNVDGALVVPPGWVITLAPAARVLNHVAAAGIMYAEVPLPQGPDGFNPVQGNNG